MTRSEVGLRREVRVHDVRHQVPEGVDLVGHADAWS